MMLRILLTAFALSVVSVSMLGAQTRLLKSDVESALTYFGLVKGNTVQFGGFHYIEWINVQDRGSGEFEIRFKTTPVRPR